MVGEEEKVKGKSEGELGVKGTGPLLSWGTFPRIHLHTLLDAGVSSTTAPMPNPDNVDDSYRVCDGRGRPQDADRGVLVACCGRSQYRSCRLE